jgi:MFS transporter, PAT family, beta-lactamase induction signal transducer AmpG
LYLAESKKLRMLTLCALYVAQGIPWGFITVTFAAWLAQPENGLKTEQIGPILGVATLPWSFKFVWGPLMDRFTIPSLGRRRPWIILAQSMAILALGSMLFFDDLPSMAWKIDQQDHWLLQIMYSVVPSPLAAMILVANIFVSVQDVAVDALAVDLLEEEERGAANGLMYGSSYLGTAIGGAGLGMLVASYDIRAGIAGQVLLLFLIMLLPIFIRERRSSASAPGAVRNPKNTGSVSKNPYAAPETEPHTPAPLPQPEPEIATSFGAVFKDLWTAFSLPSAFIGILVALGVKVGIGVLTAVFVTYLQNDGGWTMREYTTVTGGYAVLLGLCGAAMGGFAADRFGAKPLIVGTSVLLGSLWIGFGVFPAALNSHAMVTGLLLLQELLLAVMSVALFSLFMSISWPKVGATQFTTYMAMMNFSTTIGSYAAGRISQSATIFQILMLAGLLQAVLVIPVLFIDPKQTRRILGTGG